MPMDWTTFGKLAIGAGTGLEAIGLLQGGSASAKALRLKAKMARTEAAEVKRLTSMKVRLIHEAGAEHLSTIEAEVGKSGLAMTGTPLLSLVADARRIELTAALEKRGAILSGIRYEQQARALEQEARDVKRAAKRSAVGAVVGGIGSIAGLGR